MLTSEADTKKNSFGTGRNCNSTDLAGWQESGD